MVDQETIDGFALVRDILCTSDMSVVVVKNAQVLAKKQGNGISPILEVVEKLGESMHGAIVGDRILGKASALLCRYANVRGVYSPQATKTAIALLIMGGVPCQVDKMIPFIKNRDGTGMCPFEKILENIIEPETAYNILKENLR